ncbi:MAG: hypothetical protein GC181_01250 [Bacteroidetes bacterium]|nr:hypothetical protein [Bacteroidota bacterium]
MKKILPLIAVFAIVFYSCKDDETDTTPTPTDTTNYGMITKAEWRLDSGIISPSIDIEIAGNKITVNNYWDLLSYAGGGQVLDCDKDNRMICKTDSSVVMDEGPTKCDSGDPQTTDGGKWYLSDNETKITFTSFPGDPTGEPRVLDIDKLNTSALNLSMIYTFVNPITKDSTDHTIHLWYSNQK